jgi:hypothetical protein
MTQAVKRALIIPTVLLLAACPVENEDPKQDRGVDQQVLDLEPADQLVPDHALADKQVPDHALPDKQVPDKQVPDKMVPDLLVPDLPIPDQFVPTCTDKKVNGLETDVDCGGGTCPKCNAGKKCKVNKDCKSKYCINKKCVLPS